MSGLRNTDEIGESIKGFILDNCWIACVVFIVTAVLLAVDIRYVKEHFKRYKIFSSMLILCITVTAVNYVFNVFAVFLNPQGIVFAPFAVMFIAVDGSLDDAAAELMSEHFGEVSVNLAVLVIPWAGYWYCRLAEKYRGLPPGR